MTPVTKLSALKYAGDISSAYNSLRHFLEGRIERETLDDLGNRVTQLEQSGHALSFDNYFGTGCEYIENLKEKTFQIRIGNYNPKLLVAEMKKKINEISLLVLPRSENSL